MFSIDHAEFMAGVEGLWAIVNYGGYFAAIISLACGWIIWQILKHMGDEDEQFEEVEPLG